VTICVHWQVVHACGTTGGRMRSARWRCLLISLGLVVVLVANGFPAIELQKAGAATQAPDAKAPDADPDPGQTDPITLPDIPSGDVKSASANAVVDGKGGTVAPDGVPLSLRVAPGAVPDDTKVYVEVLDSKVGSQASSLGFAFKVTFSDDSDKELHPAGKVMVDVDYSAVAKLFGGDFLDRLQVTRIPDCRADSTLDPKAEAEADPTCPGNRPLITQKNDKEHTTLTVDLGPGGLTPLLEADATGGPDGKPVKTAPLNPPEGEDNTETPKVQASPQRQSSPSTSSTTEPTTTTSQAAGTPEAGSAVADAPEPSSASAPTTSIPTILPPSTTTTVAPSGSPVANSPVAGSEVAGEETAATLDTSESGGGLFALASGPAGASGDYSATPLTGVSTSQVGIQSGSAESSYPIQVPPAPAGPTPEVSLNYSSAAVDGMTSDHNTQASDAGIGWSVNISSITRDFKACRRTDAPGDLCWDDENYQITLNGVTDRLVPDFTVPGNAVWRFQHEPYWKVERLLRGEASGFTPFDRTILYPDGTTGSAYFVITTPDGTKYTFGQEVEPNSNPPKHTNSIWNVPVYNPEQTNPCHNIAHWICEQAYRWNLDRIQDVSGNVTTLFYQKETNTYNGRSGQTGLPYAFFPYVSAGRLDRIEYTKVAGAELNSDFRQQVVFDYANRCTNSDPSTCTVWDYPDTPFDLLCSYPAMPTCSQTSPTFWGTQKLMAIRTLIKNPGWTQVSKYTFGHSFPNPDPSPPSNAGASYPKLQLDAIQRVGTNQPRPTTFTYHDLYNQANPFPALATAHLETVTNELGGETVFVYSQPQPCVIGSGFDFQNQHLDCFPVWYGSTSAPTWWFFNKWVVTSLWEVDNAASMPPRITNYSYPLGPSWHYSTSWALPDYGDGDGTQAQRSWNEDRGFSRVIVSDYSTGFTTAHTFFQGMNGDRANVASLTALKTVNIHLYDGTPIADANNRAGLEAEERVARHSDGAELSRTRTTYSQRLTNSFPYGALDQYNVIVWQSFFVAPTQVEETRLGTPTKTTRTLYQDYDAYGHARLEIDEGDIGVTGDERHTDLSYTPVNPANGIHGLPTSETLRAGAVANAGTVLTKTEFMYDGGTDPISNPGPTTRGLQTTLRRWAGTSLSYDSDMTYDVRGRLATSLDGANHQTTYGYDAVWGAAGYTTATNALNQTVTTVKDRRFGLPSIVSDANSNTTSQTYDDFGRLTNVWLPTEPTTGPATKTFSYFPWTGGSQPAAVKATQLQSPGQTSDAYSWVDGWGEPVQTASKSPTHTGTNAVRMSTGYDASGHAYRVASPAETSGTYAAYAPPSWAGLSAYHEYSYDELGRTTVDRLKSGSSTTRQTTTTYDGWNSTITPPVGGATKYVADSAGNTTSVVETNGSSAYTTNYAYDLAGRRTDSTDAGGSHATTSYDWLGRKVANSDPDSGPRSFAYDADDNLISQTDARGVTIKLLYDALDRLTEKRQTSVTGPLLANYGYDATGYKGLPTFQASYDSSGNFSGIESYLTYDARNRLTSRQWWIGSSANSAGVSGIYRSAYTYDSADHLRTIQYPGGPAATLGEAVTTGYDDLGYPTTLSGTATYVGDSNYNAQGALVSQTLGASALTRSLTYEANTLRLSTLRAGSGGSTTNRQNLSYTYDDSDNVKSITDGNNSSQRECFDYDGRNRLSRAFTGSDDCQSSNYTRGSSPPPYDQSFTYDATGNFLSAGGRAYTYGTKPHAPTGVGTDVYGYDQNGAENGRVVNGVGLLMAYDPLGHMSVAANSSQTSNYVYGADAGRLIRKVGSTTTLYLEDGNYEVKSVNGGTPTTTTYYSLGDQRVAERDGSTLRYLLSDQLGSATATTDSGGGSLTRQSYFPFGDLRPGPNNNLAIDETFLGKTLDTATDLVQMGARYYDPSIGRFASPDPLADAANPQSLNPYSYGLNNPISKSDPSGLATICTYNGHRDECDPDTPGGGSHLAGKPTTRPSRPTSTHRNCWKNCYSKAAVNKAQNVMLNKVADGGWDADYFLAFTLGGNLGSSVCGTNSSGYQKVLCGNQGFGNINLKEMVLVLSAFLLAGPGVAASAVGEETLGLAAGGGSVGDSFVLPELATEEALPGLSTDAAQLEAKFKHAADFGIAESRSAAGFESFGKAVDSFVSAPDTVRVTGTFRGDAAILNYNPSTAQVVVQAPDGAFVSGWQMTPGQLQNVIAKGSLGGG
jgi:RHS repeat-associated protein